MKRIFWFLFLLLFVVGCSREYDDAELRASIASVEARLSALEKVVSAYNNNLFITSVTPVTQGYVVAFSDGTSAEVYNGKDGIDGKDGSNGKDGDTWISSVLVNADNVMFVLTDGRTMTIPIGVPLSLKFDSSDLLVMTANQTREIGYRIETPSDSIEIEVLSSADIKARVVPDEDNRKTGKVIITTTTKVDEYSKVVVIVNNGKQIIMPRIAFTDEGMDVYDNTQKKISCWESRFDLEFVSSVPYKVEIPDEAKTWLHLADESLLSRSAEKETVTLLADKNDGEYRDAYVTVRAAGGV